jgi:hypothetical protein
MCRDKNEEGIHLESCDNTHNKSGKHIVGRDNKKYQVSFHTPFI